MIEFPLRPDITKSEDYREALARMWRWCRRQPGAPIRSQRELAVRCHCSQSHLSLIFAGRRHPHPEILHALIRHLGFDPAERAYLLLAHELGQSRDPARKAEARRRMRRMRRLHEHVDLPADGRGVLDGAMVPIVFEAMGMAGFDGTAEWLAKRLVGVASRPEVDGALTCLERAGLVGLNDDRWRRLRSSLDCACPGDDVIRAYHAAVARLLGEMVSQTPPEARRCAALTLSLTEDGLGELFARIDELRGEWTDLALGYATDEATRIVQIQIAAVVIAEDPAVDDLTAPPAQGAA